MFGVRIMIAPSGNGTHDHQHQTGGGDIGSIRRLFKAYAQSLPVDLGYQGFEDELDGLPGKYEPPDGFLLLALDSTGNAVGCVAVRALADGACEMKRLYVSPGSRGSGAGRKLAQAAIAKARGIGYRQMRLDTLSAMTTAHSLYAMLGFVLIAPYYDTPVENTCSWP
jgi:GNAT superfamily N-acetyltransferase